MASKKACQDIGLVEKDYFIISEVQSEVAVKFYFITTSSGPFFEVCSSYPKVPSLHGRKRYFVG